jgi:hypothetical protein
MAVESQRGGSIPPSTWTDIRQPIQVLTCLTAQSSNTRVGSLWEKGAADPHFSGIPDSPRGGYKYVLKLCKIVLPRIKIALFQAGIVIWKELVT